MFAFTHLIPEHFAPHSKVWLYQANRPLLMSEALQLEEITENFIEQWMSHGAKVEGYANLLFGRFLFFMSNEATEPVSGCSTDSMVRVVKELEQLLQLSFTDRTQLAFVKKDKIEAIPMQQLNYALEHKIIDAHTIYFNNMVSTKNDLLENWQQPVAHSWIAKRYANLLV
jgi:galactokinase/mevalonate kinase-like predicted kinase